MREDSTNSADDKNSLIEDQNGRNDSALVQMVHRSDDVKPLKGFPTGCIIGTRLLAICKKMPALEPISKRKTSKQQQKCRRWRQFQKEKHCKRQIYNNKKTPPLLEAIYKEKRNWRQFI